MSGYLEKGIQTPMARGFFCILRAADLKCIATRSSPSRGAQKQLPEGAIALEVSV